MNKFPFSIDVVGEERSWDMIITLQKEHPLYHHSLSSENDIRPNIRLSEDILFVNLKEEIIGDERKLYVPFLAEKSWVEHWKDIITPILFMDWIKYQREKNKEDV